MVKVAVLASFNMDLVMRAARRPAAGETLQGEFAMFLGGKGFNQAVAAKRLGADVVVAGRAGDDDFGRLFLNALDREDIDRRAVVVDPTAGTGVASIIVEPDGANTILQDPRANRNVAYADWARSHGFLDANEPEGSGWIDDDKLPGFFKGVDAALANFETSDEALEAFLACARAFGTAGIVNPAPAHASETRRLELARIIVPNRLELEVLSGRTCDTIERCLAAALKIRQPLQHDAHDRVAVATLGEYGAIVVKEGLRLDVPAFTVPVVDTTGAGDAFCAALAVRMCETSDWGAVLKFANAAGALACTKHGAEPSMPYRRDVEALLAARG